MGIPEIPLLLSYSGPSRPISLGRRDVDTDVALERLLSSEKQEQVSQRRMPDFEKASKELARSGVRLKLLWMEYCEECRQLGEQLFMYFQFCFHFQKFAEQGKHSIITRIALVFMP